MKILIATLLALAILFFFTFPFIKKGVKQKHFKLLMKRKISSISLRNNFNVIDDLKIDRNGDLIHFDHIVFGNKYIYLINDVTCFNTILGKSEDNSWLMVNSHTKETNYIDNFLIKTRLDLEKFSRVAKLDKSLLVVITNLNNECNIKIDSKNVENSYVTKEGKLKKLILEKERENVSEINKEQLQIVFEDIKRQNEESKN